MEVKLGDLGIGIGEVDAELGEYFKVFEDLHKLLGGIRVASIEVIDSANKDWWRGRLNGREGLFPSSYVERLPGPPAAPYSEKAPILPTFPHVSAYNALQPYHPQNLYPHQHPYHGPPHGPPSNGPYPPYNIAPQAQPPPPPQTAIGNQEDPITNKKHGLFSGKLGNTVTDSLS
jgi:hypothetical protein